MAATDFEVVEIVRRRDLDRATTLLRVGIFVADDGQSPTHQRQDRVPTGEMLVALVIGMDRDRGIAEHGLRASRRNGDESIFEPFEWILQVPKIALHLD